MRLLVTRPEPDALKLRAALEEHGHQATVEPLLSVSFEDGDALDLDGVQALIATSRNALRALKSHPLRGLARKLPLFAVGRATAAEGRTLGFETVVTGAGTAEELVAHIVSVAEPSAGLLLHLAGDSLAGDLAGELESHGFRVLQPVVYRMRPATALTDDDRRAARHGRDRGRHPDVAAICVNLCLADAQARAYFGGPAADPFLPLRSHSRTAAAAGCRPRGDRGSAPARRSACPD